MKRTIVRSRVHRRRRPDPVARPRRLRWRRATATRSPSDDSTSQSTTESSPSASESTATDAGADTFGEGCAAIPTDGKGSFDGMVTDPVATAASNNPLLKTLVAAVTEADLVDTLNSAPALTVFARPTTRSARSRRRTSTRSSQTSRPCRRS